MSKSALIRLAGRHRWRLVPLAALGMVAASVPMMLPASATQLPTATQIVVTTIPSTPSIDVPNTGAQPASFIVAGVPFTFGVTLEDANGNPTPFSYNKATTLSLKVSSGSTSLSKSGTLSVDVPAGGDTATFDNVILTTEANGVVIEVDGPKARGSQPPALAPAFTAPLDVQSSVQTGPGSSTLTSIGAGGGVGSQCSPTKQDPVCATLVLPDGSTTSQLLSLGVCDSVVGCPTDQSVVQWLVGLDSTVYTRTNPGTLIVACDKSLCPGGGISSYSLGVNLDPTGPLVAAPACPAKDTIGADQTYCVDYVQSNRTNAGDTLLYLLFLQDGRASFL